MRESSQIERDTDALYDLRPGEFVPARDALAKQLRTEGAGEQAAAVKALPRPTVAAWAVNQLARREPEWTQALATAGQRLEDAQAALISDGDRDAWREANASQREAIERLARMAERLLREERGSVSGALRDAIRETLHAATVDHAARDAVLAGRLDRELRASGLLGADPTARRVERFERAEEEDAGAKPATPRGAAKPAGPRAAKPAATPSESQPAAAPKRAASKTASAAAEREARAARRVVEREARAEIRRAERDVVAARSSADRTEKALGRAHKAHDAAVSQLEDAQEAADARAAELDRAAQEHDVAAELVAHRVAAIEAAKAELERVLEQG